MTTGESDGHKQGDGTSIEHKTSRQIDGHAVLLMSTLQNDGQVKSRVCNGSDDDIPLESIVPKVKSNSGSSNKNNNGGTSERLHKPQVHFWDNWLTCLCPHNWKRRRREEEKEEYDKEDVSRQHISPNHVQLLDCRQQQPNIAVGGGSQSNSPSEADTFNVYQLSLRVGPFKRSICLLAFISLALILTTSSFRLLQIYHRRASGAVDANNHHNGTEPSLNADGSDTHYHDDYDGDRDRDLTLVASSFHLMILAYVAYKTQLGSYRSPEVGEKEYFGVLQLTLLISSSLFATFLAIWRAQLIALLPAIMFILYTLLSVNNQIAFTVTLASNLIHLLSVPFTSSLIAATSAGHQQYSGSTEPGVSNVSQVSSLVIVVVVTYLIFHAIGLYLNKQTLTDNRCIESFNDIKSSISAKIMLDFEDRKLNKMLESVIPEHLVGKMRDDIMKPQRIRIFHKIYLDYYENVSILFADIVNFTKISSNCSALTLVECLNELFGRFDKAADKNKCLRIKILGDCYYCVCGIPEWSDDHAIGSVEMGLDMIDILADLPRNDVDLNMRVGIHSGRVLCGVLGKTRWQFDVHSNDVKLANHTEQSGEPGRVHITQDTLKALKGRYEVVEANGHLRDTYIAQQNISTYFVIAPTNRRKSSVKSACDIPSNSIVMSSVRQQMTTAPMSDVSLQPADRTDNARLPAGTTTTTTTTTANRKQIPPAMQQPRLNLARTRFKSAGQRIINVLHFIRTIEVPFSNLECPTSADIERSIHETIVSRSKLREVHPLTLKFKDNEMSRLYEPPSKFKLLRWALIFFTAFICLTYLAYRTSPLSIWERSSDTLGPEHRLDKDNFTTTTVAAGPALPEVQRQKHAGKEGGEDDLNDDETATTDRLLGQTSPTLGLASGTGSEDSAQWHSNHKESYFLIGQILLTFVLSVLVYVHQVEYNSRRDFLWRQIALQDKERMTMMRDCNKFIFFNLLPAHVAEYFLEKNTARHMDLYHKSYERIGVVFATIANFSDFYSENQGNQHGLECLRLLNEILLDFDSILEEEKFHAVEKIKTIGTTYMAAIGLSPDYELPPAPVDISKIDTDTSEASSIQENNGTYNKTYNAHNSVDISPEVETTPTDSYNNGMGMNKEKPEEHDQKPEVDDTRAEVARYLQILIDFVLEMRARLQDINEHSYNLFKLRVGINLGPVTAGVIGASKPQYDIWGNTVNVASRMESTAESNKIQITSEVYNILKDFNEKKKYKFTCRGSINVKGKGVMTTYYLDC